VKGAPLLLTLLGVAIFVGNVLYLADRGGEQTAPANTTLSPAAFVAQQLDLPLGQPAPLQAVSPETLRHRIGANLDAHFGPGGLARRTRAYELLTLLPSGQNLHDQFLAMQAAGCRGWFADRTGDLLVAEDFAPLTRPDDRATLIRLRTLEFLRRASFTLSPDADDDQWFAHRAIHGALAEALQIADQSGALSNLPTAEETEREAILLTLPILIHNLAQSPELLGLPYLRQRSEAAPTPWITLLREAPTHTHGLLHCPPDPLPALPQLGSTLLEESLGAYATQLLLERHSDFEQAESLTPHWRGDHYRLFANGRGDHLLWHCQWATPEAATNAANLLRSTLTPEGTIPGTTDRHFLIETRHRLLLVLNCSDPDTLAALRQVQP